MHCLVDSRAGPSKALNVGNLRSCSVWDPKVRGRLAPWAFALQFNPACSVPGWSLQAAESAFLSPFSHLDTGKFMYFLWDHFSLTVPSPAPKWTGSMAMTLKQFQKTDFSQQPPQRKDCRDYTHAGTKAPETSGWTCFPYRIESSCWVRIWRLRCMHILAIAR